MSTFFLLFAFLTPNPSSSQSPWSESLTLAEKEDKPVVVLFSASWCGPCKMFKKSTLKDEHVQEFLEKRAVFIEIDGEKGEGIGLVKKYRIPGFPTLLIVDASGDVLDKKMGFLAPAEFLRWMRNVFP